MVCVLPKLPDGAICASVRSSMNMNSRYGFDRIVNLIFGERTGSVALVGALEVVERREIVEILARRDPFPARALQEPRW